MVVAFYIQHERPHSWKKPLGSWTSLKLTISVCKRLCKEKQKTSHRRGENTCKRPRAPLSRLSRPVRSWAGSPGFVGFLSLCSSGCLRCKLLERLSLELSFQTSLTLCQALRWRSAFLIMEKLVTNVRAPQPTPSLGHVRWRRKNSQGDSECVLEAVTPGTRGEREIHGDSSARAQIQPPFPASARSSAPTYFWGLRSCLGQNMCSDTTQTHTQLNHPRPGCAAVPASGSAEPTLLTVLRGSASPFFWM